MSSSTSAADGPAGHWVARRTRSCAQRREQVIVVVRLGGSVPQILEGRFRLSGIGFGTPFLGGGIVNINQSCYNVLEFE